MSELPEGWSETSLESLVLSSLGGDWGKDCHDELSGYEKVGVVRGTDYRTWKTDRAARAAERRIKRSSLETRRLVEGDIVVEVSGGGPTQPVGRTILIDKMTLDNSRLPLVCSNFFRQVRLRKWVDSAYINHFLTHSYFKGKFDEFQTQTTNLRNLNFTKFLNETLIHLPPLNEQRRIVAKLEKLLSRVDAAQARLATIPRILKRFRQSVLAAACSGRLTADLREKHTKAEPHKADNLGSSLQLEFDVPSSWVLSKIGELTTLITSGSRGWAEYYADKGAIFIRAQNINTDKLLLDGVAYVSLPNEAEGRRTKTERNDILITITGANVTKSALIEVDLDDAYVSQHVALVRLTDKRFSKFLFFWIISSEHGRKQLQEAAYGAGKPGLNLDNIRNVTAALPTFGEQQEIVRRVEALFTTADALKARYRTAKAHVDKLTQSILARAFRGELVTTEAELARREGRAYEPASVLLERIRQERMVGATRSGVVDGRRVKPSRK